MYQLYIYFSPSDKRTETYISYDAVVARIVELKPTLIAAPSYFLSIIDPGGTQIQSVNK